MIRLFLSDLNGTAYDDVELAYGSLVKTFETHGLAPPTKTQFCNEITSRYTDFYYKYGFKENFSGKGIQGDADEFNKVRKAYYEQNDSRARLRLDFAKTLSDLKSARIQVGIVSAEVESVVVALLDKAGLVELIGLDNIHGNAYGDKAPVLLDACRAVGVNPEEAVYLDDTVDGLVAASMAGLMPIGFGKGYNSPERLHEVAPLIVYEFSQIPSLIELLNNPGRLI